MRKLRPFITTLNAAGVATMLSMLTACSSPTRTRYLTHTSVVLAPTDATGDELALAFGLDEFAPTVVAAAEGAGEFDRTTP